jgi:hypothetical protein
MVASPLCWSRNSLISSNASPSLLAHHLTAAGETEHAVSMAESRPSCCRTISPCRRDGLEIELQLARGSSLFTAHGFNATDAGNVYARARELAERRGDSHQLFMAVYGLWQSAAGSGKILAVDCPADCSN